MEIVCFCHLRWDFVYQRPQHLMSRAARQNRVFVIEEPVNGSEDAYRYSLTQENIHRFVPTLDESISECRIERLRKIIAGIITDYDITNYVSWYYSPLFYEYTNQLCPQLIVYDCMDELSAFKFANPALKKLETKLLAVADILFTGGHSLYMAKKDLHSKVYCFPSSIDHEHFLKGRNVVEEPVDQAQIPFPRLGFFGVVDERFDIELLREASQLLPDHQFIIIGPIIKIDPVNLPTADNIHYLGSKTYEELPKYISGWDVALVLFALNEATRFISPTKTPEYLCAGKPVISTPIADVIHDYGSNPMVHIAYDTAGFISSVKQVMSLENSKILLRISDDQLKKNSWDITYNKMHRIILNAMEKSSQLKTEPIYV
jgi:glycosyltransferase involved in cell wall biosynthesis